MIQLNDRWRIVESNDRPPYRQWLLERSRQKYGKELWEAQSFCQTRKGLMVAIKEKIARAERYYPNGKTKSMSVDPVALHQVSMLPEKIVQEVGFREGTARFDG